MKKVFITFILILVFFLLYFLQVNFFSMFTINGISPNLFIIFILCIGLFTNQFLTLFLSIVFGLMLDFSFGTRIGITSIMLCIIGYIASYFDQNFSKENRITIIIMVAISTFIYEFGYYFLKSSIIGFEREYLFFFRIVTIEIIYNVLLTILFYPLIHKVGFIIDRNFKENNILTRYF